MKHYWFSLAAMALVALLGASTCVRAQGFPGEPGLSGHCNDAVCPSVCKSCMAVPTTVKRTRTEYGSKAINYCLPPCGRCAQQHHCNEDCGQDGGCGRSLECGPVRTRHVLLKRVVTEERPGTKCEPVSIAPATPQCSVSCPAPCEMPRGAAPSVHIGDPQPVPMPAEHPPLSGPPRPRL